MKCVNHLETDAKLRCIQCGSPICEECITEVNGEILCSECNEKNIIKATQDKIAVTNTGAVKKSFSGFWAFILSLFPGAGHMYLGLMNRGLQIMASFLTIFVLMNFLYSSGYLMPLVVLVWFYSFFDCYHIKKSIRRGEEVEDTLIYDMDISKFNLYHVGIGLVAVGGLILINETLLELSFSGIFRDTFRFLRRIFLPLLLILGGLQLLRRSKK